MTSLCGSRKARSVFLVLGGLALVLLTPYSGLALRELALVIYNTTGLPPQFVGGVIFLGLVWLLERPRVRRGITPARRRKLRAMVLARRVRKNPPAPMV